LFNPKVQDKQNADLLASAKLYAIVDAARIEDTWLRLQTDSPHYTSLYQGDEAQELEDVAPYLVELKPDEDFTHWVLEVAYGDCGCIFLHSHYELEKLKNHLQPWVKIDFPVEMPSGETQTQSVFYAFYDPRVFSRFMQSVSIEEGEQFFNPLAQVQCENQDKPNLLSTFCINQDNNTLNLVTTDLTQEETPCQS
jgi:hypothetical protein